MTAQPDWERWEERWRARRMTGDQLDAMIERTRRARRGLMLFRRLPTALAVAALAVVAAALRHAGNAFEATLGLVVALGIFAAWLMNAANQRQAADKVEAPADEYQAVRRELCRRQDRFATLGWVVVALDLTFLIPWWIGGIAVHGQGVHLIQLLTVWGPLALMVGFLWATIRLRRRARAELARLSEPNGSTQ